MQPFPEDSNLPMMMKQRGAVKWFPLKKSAHPTPSELLRNLVSNLKGQSGFTCRLSIVYSHKYLNRDGVHKLLQNIFRWSHKVSSIFILSLTTKTFLKIYTYISMFSFVAKENSNFKSIISKKSSCKIHRH